MVSMTTTDTSQGLDRLDLYNLEDTGVALTLHLDTDPITLGEAEAFFVFINRSITSLVKAWQPEYLYDDDTPIQILPFIEVDGGSAKATVRFRRRRRMVIEIKESEKKEQSQLVEEAVSAAAKDLAKNYAKKVLVSLFAAFSFFLPGGDEEAGAKAQQAPPAVQICIN